MALSTVALEGFPGIRLDVDPAELGLAGARDCVNCMVREAGMLETRPGYANLPGSAFANDPSAAALGVMASPIVAASNTYIIVWQSNGDLQAIRRSTGAVIGGTVAGTNAKSYADMGTAAQWRIFVADLGVGIRYFNGIAWGGPVGPAGIYLAAWQDQLRLVTGNIFGTSTSRVQFSNVGDGATWTASDYIDLTPNDGDQITAVVAWREYVFVFKSRRFFVFYSISSTATGAAIFNYRTIDTGIGCIGVYHGSAIATPDGVYFLGPDGVYRTNGGPPVKISQALDPWVKPEVNPANETAALSRFATSPFTISNIGVEKLASGQLTYLDGILYWRPSAAGTQPDLFSYDGNNWRRYQFPLQLGGMVALTDLATHHELVFADKLTFRLVSWAPRNPVPLTDQGSVAISWAYDIGPYRVAGRQGDRVRRTRLLGAGANVTLKMASDASDPQTDATGATLAWPAGEWGEAWSNVAYRSRYDSLFSTRLSGSGKSTVHRVEHQIG